MSSGVVLMAGIGGRQRRVQITALSQLEIGKAYMTQKGTSLFRRSQDELILGGACAMHTRLFVFWPFLSDSNLSAHSLRTVDRVEIPIEAPTQDNMIDGEMYLVLRGRLLPQTLLLALENFTRKVSATRCCVR